MIKNFLRALVPPRFRPQGYLVGLIRKRTKQHVATGPFAGMKYVSSAYYSAYPPKLLGTYEKELADAVNAGIALQPDRIIDVGAAEGYYAVGLALRNPRTQVVAFEMDESSRKLLNELITLNEVGDRVEVRGKCEPQDLTAALAGTNRPLIVCDVEGYELDLIDPAVVPGLSGAYILVELHDHAVSGMGEIIEKRFAATHRLHRIWPQKRSADEWPYPTWITRLMPASLVEFTMNEWRPARMSWLWMEPLP